MRILFTISVLFCLAANIFAATYYVDFDAGSDSNNGTSTGTAFKRSPGDASATGTAASTTLVAGDTVKFKGGVTNTTGGITVSATGTSGSRIKFDGNSAGDWGTGKALIDGNYVSNLTAITVATGKSYITIDNLIIQNVGGWADDATNVVSAAGGTYTNITTKPGVGIYTTGANTNIYITGCEVRRVGGWRNTMGWDGRSLSGVGYQLDNSYGMTVTNSKVTKCGGVGIALYAKPNTWDATLIGNDIRQNINWGIDMAITLAGGSISNVNITQNRLEDLNQMGGDWTGVANEYEPHQNYIFLRSGGEPTPWQYVNIFRNWLGETNASLGGTGGTGAIFISQGPSANICNNVFYRTWNSTGVIPIFYDTPTEYNQVVRVYNNTFYRGTAGAALAVGTVSGTNRHVYALNNIFSHWGSLNIQTDLNFDLDPLVMDYSIYYSTNFDSGTRLVSNRASSYTTLAGLQSASALEDNGQFGDPGLAAPVTGNVSIATNSLAATGGTNLTSIYASMGIPAVDYAGNALPSSGAWPIGAYDDTQNAATFTRSYRTGKSVTSGKVVRQ